MWCVYCSLLTVIDVEARAVYTILDKDELMSCNQVVINFAMYVSAQESSFIPLSVVDSAPLSHQPLSSV